MNKVEAAKELNISIRSLQRLAQDEILKVVYQRGASGKQEAVFDAEQIAKYKLERDKPTDKLVKLPTYDKKQLARNDTQQFLEIFKTAITAQKPIVPIADKILLTVKDCQLLTGLSEQTIRDSIRDTKLKARVIGRGFKVKRTDLDEFINKL
jgi:excisionase family DNA binding protein